MTMIAHRRRFAAAMAGMATAAAIAVALAPAAAADDEYGSIAYSGNGSWGRATDFPTKGAAEAAAISSCGYPDCSSLTTFTDCGAVALNGNHLQGGLGPTLSAAIKDALTRAGGGSIDTWGCN
jgi:hypothetical protein